MVLSSVHSVNIPYIVMLELTITHHKGAISNAQLLWHLEADSHRLFLVCLPCLLLFGGHEARGKGLFFFLSLHCVVCLAPQKLKNCNVTGGETEFPVCICFRIQALLFLVSLSHVLCLWSLSSTVTRASSNFLRVNCNVYHLLVTLEKLYVCTLCFFF